MDNGIYQVWLVLEMIVALRNYPGVYTRTSAYLNWIQSKIKSI